MILNEIVARTRQLLEVRKIQSPIRDVKKKAMDNRPPLDFAEALSNKGISLIAEVKRASPSKGILNSNLNVSRLARIYEQNGAAAISVLTESEYFKGSLSDLEAAREAVKIPILRKDFIFDQYQVYEARAYGADAVLLIAGILNHKEIISLLKTIHSLNMAALIEVHNQDELMKVWDISPKIIGVNNRNLADFTVDLETTLNLRLLIPSETIVVSESGIHNRKNVIRLQMAGVNAILVGEALVTSKDPAKKIRELIGSTEQDQV